MQLIASKDILLKAALITLLFFVTCSKITSFVHLMWRDLTDCNHEKKMLNQDFYSTISHLLPIKLYLNLN